MSDPQGSTPRSRLPFAVGRVDCTSEVDRYATLEEAEARIEDIAKRDPEGVAAGHYYIDAPEQLAHSAVDEWRKDNVTPADLKRAEDKFFALIEEAWYAETKGELDLTEDPDDDTLDLVRGMERAARTFIDMDASSQFTPGVGGAPTEIEGDVTEEEIARRIAVALSTLTWGWN